MRVSAASYQRVGTQKRAHILHPLIRRIRNHTFIFFENNLAAWLLFDNMILPQKALLSLKLSKISVKQGIGRKRDPGIGLV